MAAPLKPHWKQPSHPAIQEVIIAANSNEFTTKSISRVDLPPFALFASLSSPPLTPAAAPSYATVQVGKHQHINLNSDLLYINHSCDPSLIFDMSSRVIWVGPKGLRQGDELTFFYPSTEWDMAQPFACLCGSATCRGRISGAGTMPRDQLAGLWLNAHIWELLQEKDAAEKAAAENAAAATTSATNGKTAPAVTNPTLSSLEDVLGKAEDTLRKADEAAEAARFAVASYLTALSSTNGSARRGPTSRELSGEMSGDTART